MKLSMKEFFQKCQMPLILVFATAPVCLFLYGYLVPGLLHLCWITPAAYVVLFILAFLIPGKLRLVYGIIATAALATVALVPLVAGVPYPLLPSSKFFLLIVPVFYCILLLWSLPMASWSSQETLPSFCYWGGILFHLVFQILKFLIVTMVSDSLKATDGAQLVCFFAFAALAMIRLTQGNLASAANGRHAPASMQRKNLVLIMVFFAIALLISLMPAIIDAIRGFIDWLLELLGQALSNIDDHGEISSVAPMQPTMDGEVVGAPPESGLLTKIFNILFLVLGSCVMLVAAYYGVRTLIRLLRKLIRRFLSGLSDYAANISEDYIDEITDTRTTVPKRKRKRISSADERAMTPAQRIRYRYQRLLYKHPNWDQGSTARENLPTEAAAVYEQARYSSHPVTQEDAALFVSKTKKV